MAFRTSNRHSVRFKMRMKMRHARERALKVLMAQFDSTNTHAAA